jgi:DNA repair exonuclease SbcCD nuclease subunit
MINKIIHFSDLHIRLFKDHDLYREIMTNALDEWKAHKPDRIVFTGDLVHSKNQMTPELINFVVWILGECSKICKTVLIIGNHDFLESNLNRIDALSPIIDSLENDNIVYHKDSGVYNDENIDWVVYSLVNHNVRPQIDKSDNLKIGLFHGPIQGLTTDIGYKFEDGFDTDRFKGCDLVLCGDIHKRQTFNIPGKKKAYMIGSTIQQNFGESVNRHGYGVYHIKDDKYETFDLVNPRPFLNFKINSIEDLEKGKERLVNA